MNTFGIGLPTYKINAKITILQATRTKSKHVRTTRVQAITSSITMHTYTNYFVSRCIHRVLQLTAQQSVFARWAEATVASVGVVQTRQLDQRWKEDSLQDELSDAVSFLHLERLVVEIKKNHADVAAVVLINHTRSYSSNACLSLFIKLLLTVSSYVRLMHFDLQLWDCNTFKDDTNIPTSMKCLWASPDLGAILP